MNVRAFYYQGRILFRKIQYWFGDAAALYLFKKRHTKGTQLF